MMNFKKSQAGFTPIHLLLILVLIGIIGLVGWKVYDAGKSVKPGDSSTTPEPVTTKEDSKIPDGFEGYENKEKGFKFAYPQAWGKVTEYNIAEVYGQPSGEYGNKTPILELGFSNLKKYDRLTVWKKEMVSISTSFNAPSYCSFNTQTNKWEPVSGSYATAESCNKGTRNIDSVTVYQFTKGALGAYGFIEVFELDNNFVEFSSNADYQQDFADNQQSGAPDLKPGVADRIKKMVEESTNQLIKANKKQD